jgi:hypothetical protein
MVLLVWLALQADPAAEALRGLGSESLDERAEASRRLKELGPAALPALRQAAASPDPEVRGHALSILDFIVRRERVRTLRPSERRVTQALDGVTLAKAVESTLRPFGFDDLRDPPQDSDRRISVVLKDAGFWEVVEALETAASLQLDPASGTWSAAPERPKARVGSGGIRLSGGSWGGVSSAGGKPQPALYLKAWLPPGAWPSSVMLEDVEMTDSQGKVLEVKQAMEGSAERRFRKPTETRLPALVADRDALKGVKTVNARGTLVLGFPRDVDRAEAPMPALPARVAMLGGWVSLDKLSLDIAGRWDCSIQGQGGTEPFDFLLSMEDADGHWLADLMADRLWPSSSFGAARTVDGGTQGTPARLVLLRTLGEETLRVPFALKGLPAPD